ncbi:protein phosphatase 2C domain-containing protein [Burkholderia ambifaria]|uniref:protein phosphatase 2C domain-containing protein n=1 Tax=Burkholderia ambifaria TaxID=152480 RepID=UPI00158E1349|nr:protein phosphatase 2C domain-containing protein [Burkholderia ambifaria]
MHLVLEFQATVPKVIDEPERNEDAVCIDEDHGVFAVADGASQSFDSRAWARLLVSRFVEQPAVNPEWVDAARQDYDRTWDYDSLSWSEQMAFDRGSFSTLLGCEWREHLSDLEIFAVGDSIAVHLEGSSIVQSYPYTAAHEFDQRPQLLSTRAEANRFVHSPSFNNSSGTVWHLNENSTVLLMTDALGQWLLSQQEGAEFRLGMLLSADTETAFTEVVLSQRSEGALRIDDTSLLVLAARSRVETL